MDLPIIQVGDVLVSPDIITEQFCCDLDACKGECCIEGDAGAPVTTGAKSPMAYVLTLLQDWHYAGVRTADEVGEYAYLRDVVEGRQPGDREKAQQGLAQMRRRHQQMPDGSEEGADG